MGAFIRKCRPKETGILVHFTPRFDEEWTILETYDLTRDLVVNQGSLACLSV